MNFSPRWSRIVLLLGARGARQPITLVFFARSGGALLDNASATTSVINKKFRKEAFAFLLVLYSYLDVSNNSIQKVGMAQWSCMPRVGYVIWCFVIVVAMFPVLVVCV